MIHLRRFEGYKIVVAGVALGRSWYMRCRFCQCVVCRIGTTMACRTLRCRAGMTHARRFERGETVVAGVTLGRGRDMRRILPECGHAVVAGCTSAYGGSGFVDIRRACPDNRRTVTCVALLGGDDVRRRLFLRIYRQICTTMAGRTIIERNRAGGSRMRHDRRRKRRIVLVAAIALRIGGYVIDGSAERSRSVVATRAAPRGGRICSGVIECNRCPSRCRFMARIALGGRRNVGWSLGLGVDREVNTAMAGRTKARRSAVVHGSGCPCNEPARVA